MLVCPYFVQKNVHSLKNTVFSCPYFVQKTQFSKKTFLSFFFSNFKWKTSCCHAHIWTKTSILSNYTIISGKTVNKMTFFRFSWKNTALMPIFCKKRAFSKNYTVLIPIFWQKMSILSKTLCSHVICFKFFIKNQCCHASI